MKTAFVVGFLFISLVTSFALAAPGRPVTNQESESKKQPKKIVSEAGLNIPQWGVAIDAVYDSRLDNLIPGFKILNVVLTNRGPQTIYLDPQKDKWAIVDNINGSRQGINHLRLHNEKLWATLPQGLKDKLEYPHAVRTGNSTQIDLFFPLNTELANFREISWNSSHFKKEFSVYTVMEKNLDIDKNQPIPSNPSAKQAFKKYEEPLSDEPSPAVEDAIKNDPPSEAPDLFSIPSLRDQ